MKKIIFVSLLAIAMLILAYGMAMAKDDKLTIVNVSASSTYYTPPYYGTANAIDGNDNTFWIGSHNAAPWWIMFEMEKVEEVAKINIKWYSDYYLPQNYNIQISSDGAVWEDLYAGIPGVYNADGEISEIRRKAKYIRLYIMSVSGYYPVLREFAAYHTVNIPHIIRFQGILGDTSGMPLEGAFTLTFRLYDADTGGVPLWEETQENISIVKGALDVELGTVTPIDVVFNKQYWLGIEVGSDGEMSPRFKLTSVPYAFTSER